MGIVTTFLARTGSYFTGIIKVFFGNTLAKEILFGAGLSFGSRILRFFGLIAFLSVFFSAFTTGMNTGTTPEQKITIFGSVLAKEIIGVDQYIYEQSISFNQIQTPTLWQGLKTFYNIISKIFFYIWWFRVWLWIINFTGFWIDEQGTSTPDLEKYYKAFILLYISLLIVNIIYMISNGTLSFNFKPVQTASGLNQLQNLGYNIGNIITVLGSNLLQIVWAFKGIMHYIGTGGFYKFLLLLRGDQIITKTTQNITNITNTTL